MRNIAVVLVFCCFFSCARTNKGYVSQSAEPIAILKTGEQPLWFQFGEHGPELLYSIEDACYSRALIPWPHAIHARFILARNNDVYLAVNKDGFLVFSPWEEKQAGHGYRASLAKKTEHEANSAGQAAALYRFPGNDYWQPYTIAAFVLLDDIPAAFLYRDEHFLDTDIPLPSPRAWTFNMQYSFPLALDIPALRSFPASEGWDIDAFRCSAGGSLYFRAVKKNKADPEIVYLHSADFAKTCIKTGKGAFFNSALPEPLSFLPVSLWTLHRSINSPGTVMLVSPEFISQRYFAEDANSPVRTFAYTRSSPDASLLIDVHGNGAAEAAGRFFPIALPELPENFYYTGITLSGNDIIALWEEQEEYNIGAAGFMVLRFSNN